MCENGFLDKISGSVLSVRMTKKGIKKCQETPDTGNPE
jgi:hypothetical protein